MPVLFLNTTLQNSTGKQCLLYCTNDVNFEISLSFFWMPESFEIQKALLSSSSTKEIKNRISFVFVTERTMGNSPIRYMYWRLRIGYFQHQLYYWPLSATCFIFRADEVCGEEETIFQHQIKSASPYCPCHRQPLRRTLRRVKRLQQSRTTQFIITISVSYSYILH